MYAPGDLKVSKFGVILCNRPHSPICPQIIYFARQGEFRVNGKDTHCAEEFHINSKIDIPQIGTRTTKNESYTRF